MFAYLFQPPIIDPHERYLANVLACNITEIRDRGASNIRLCTCTRFVVAFESR